MVRKNYSRKIKRLDRYIKITNNDNKIWILPYKDLKISFNLYQPSSWKGKFLKQLFPFINRIPLIKKWIRKILNIVDCEYFILEELDNLIRSVFNIQELEDITYAFFLGTPSTHQKTTIQISHKNKILGYCKYTDNRNILNLFYHEQRILDELSLKNVPNIPICLYCGELSNGIGVFIQNTTKTVNSVVEHKLLLKHIQFLEVMKNKTQIKCEYKESDYYLMLCDFKKNLANINTLTNLNYNIDELTYAVNIIEKSLSSKKYFSCYHGDFTPWNIFFESNQIFVFDFEYSKLKYPENLDAFHFFTQVCIFEKEWSSDKIFNEFTKLFVDGYFNKVFEDSLIGYLIYLIDITAFYISRDKEKINKDVEKNLCIWKELISKILKKI